MYTEAEQVKILTTPKKELIGVVVSGVPTLSECECISDILVVCGATIPSVETDDFVPYKVTNNVQDRIAIFDVGPYAVLVISAFSKPKVPNELLNLNAQQKTKGILAIYGKDLIAIAAMGHRKEQLKTLLRAFKRQALIFGGKLGDEYKAEFNHGFRLLVQDQVRDRAIKESITYHLGQVRINAKIADAKIKYNTENLLLKLAAVGKTCRKVSYHVHKGDVLINIIPHDTEKYNSGMFQLLALKEWLKGTGPIVK